MTTMRRAKQEPESKDPEIKTPEGQEPAAKVDHESPPQGEPEGQGDEDEEADPEERQEKERQSLAALLKADPRLAAQHGKLLAQAKRQAEADAKKRLQEEADAVAKRANMDEVARLKADLVDKDKAHERLERELREAQVDRDISRALVEGGVRLQDGALDVLRDKVLAATRDEETPDYVGAVSEVLEKFSWLRQGKAPVGEERAEPEARGQAPAQPRRPGAKPGTVTPARPEPQKPVDVMKMSPQEYAKHRREKGIT